MADPEVCFGWNPTQDVTSYDFSVTIEVTVTLKIFN